MIYSYDGPGIYEILNQYTGDCYIGSSKNVLRRLKDHFRELKAGNHPNKKLQAGYNRFGAHFVCFVLEEMPEADKARLLDAEAKYIDQTCNASYNQGLPRNTASVASYVVKLRKPILT